MVKKMSNNNEWKKIEVVFRLKSPLHIGYLPSKYSVVSPTRYYVPGRNLWGAITKRITEYLYSDPLKDCQSSETNEGTCYQKVGEIVKNNFRFSYFYIYDGKTVYFPKYTEEGLKYGNITKEEFEYTFISNRISTAINKEGSAKDKSLHEIEFINNKFRDKKGNIKDVKISGSIWVKDNIKIKDRDVVIKSNGLFIDGFNIVEELILGGESKYGFGHVVFDHLERKKDEPVVHISKDKPFINAHLKYNKDIKFQGDVELLTGRGYFDPKEKKSTDKPGSIISNMEYYISPGSKLNEEFCLKIEWDGSLEILKIPTKHF